MNVVYIAKHRGEPGETVLCRRPDSAGVPHSGDWVILLHGWDFLVETLTLLPGKEWQARCLMNRKDAESLRDTLDRVGAP